MLNEFLDILKDGYTVEFSENNTIKITKITVSKHGKSVSHSVNLEHLQEYGLKKEITIVTIIRQLIADLEQQKVCTNKENKGEQRDLSKV